jgi:hypothetical protein
MLTNFLTCRMIICLGPSSGSVVATTTRHSLASRYMSLSFASSPHSPELLIHSSWKKSADPISFHKLDPIIDSWLPFWAGLPPSAQLHMSRKAAGDEHIAAPCHRGRDLTSPAKASFLPPPSATAEVMRRRARGGLPRPRGCTTTW